MNIPSLAITLNSVLIAFSLTAPPAAPAPSSPEALFKFIAYDVDPQKPDPKDMTFQIVRVDRSSASEFFRLGETISRSSFKLLKFQFKTRTHPKYGPEDASELTLIDTGTQETFVLTIPAPIHPPPDAPDFSKYPMSAEKFKYFVNAHFSGNFAFELKPAATQALILAISYFTDGKGGSATEYFATNSGYTKSCIEMPYWSTRGDEERQLTVEQLARLNEAIAKLPKDSTYPPITQLAIVSFRLGDSWTTRTCRREDLQVIHDVIGKRKEN